MKYAILCLVCWGYFLPISSQPYNPREILHLADHNLQLLDEFACEFSFRNNQNNINEQGQFYFLRDKEDPIYGGKFRLETNSYSISYNLKHVFYVKHPRHKVEILDLGRIERKNYPGGLEIVTPEEWMLNGLQYYPDDLQATYSVSQHGLDHWLITVERKIDDPGFDSWTKHFLINKHSNFVEGIRVKMKYYGRVFEANWEMLPMKGKVNVSEVFKEFAVPLDYSLYYRPIQSVRTSNESDKYLPVGTHATEFSLPDLNGNVLSLSDYKDQLILLDFWEHWCGPCLKSIPKLKSYHEKYSEKGLQIFGIFSEKKEIVTNIVNRNEIPYPNLEGNESLHEIWGIKSFPTVFLIKNGKILYSGSGNNPQLEAEIQKYIE